MPRTLDQINQDFQSYKALTRRQKGVTLFAEKYVEDVGILLAMIQPEVKLPPEAADTSPDTVSARESRKAKTLKAE